MLTRLTDADWTVVPGVFSALCLRRGTAKTTFVCFSRPRKHPHQICPYRLVAPGYLRCEVRERRRGRRDRFCGLFSKTQARRLAGQRVLACHDRTV